MTQGTSDTIDVCPLDELEEGQTRLVEVDGCHRLLIAFAVGLAWPLPAR